MKKPVCLMLCALIALCMCGALAEGITVTDMTGREIALEAPLTRVVTLQPSDAEILYYLGALDVLVGRGTYVDYPEEVLDIPVVNSGAETNLEEILALQPQAVIMPTMAQPQEQIAALENAGVAVIVTDASDIAGVYDAMTLIGAVVGRDAEAAELVEQMRAAFDDIAAQAGETGKTVYFEISPLAYGLWTAGQGTFMDELAALCGLTNVFGDPEGWQSVSSEQVIALNPDYIITTTNYPVDGMDPLEEIAAREGWESITAVANGDVVIADNNTMTRPSPRLVEAAQFLLELLQGAQADSAA